MLMLLGTATALRRTLLQEVLWLAFRARPPVMAVPVTASVLMLLMQMLTQMLLLMLLLAVS